MCIKDLNHLNIRLKGKGEPSTPEIKSEPTSDDDIEQIIETPSPSDIVKAELRFPSATPDSMSTSSPSDTPNTPEGGTGRYDMFQFIQTVCGFYLYLYRKLDGKTE